MTKIIVLGALIPIFINLAIASSLNKDSCHEVSDSGRPKHAYLFRYEERDLEDRSSSIDVDSSSEYVSYFDIVTPESELKNAIERLALLDEKVQNVTSSLSKSKEEKEDNQPINLSGSFQLEDDSPDNEPANAPQDPADELKSWLRMCHYLPLRPQYLTSYSADEALIAEDDAKGLLSGGVPAGEKTDEQQKMIHVDVGEKKMRVAPSNALKYAMAKKYVSLKHDLIADFYRVLHGVICRDLLEPFNLFIENQFLDICHQQEEVDGLLELCVKNPHLVTIVMSELKQHDLLSAFASGQDLHRLFIECRYLENHISHIFSLFAQYDLVAPCRGRGELTCMLSTLSYVKLKNSQLQDEEFDALLSEKFDQLSEVIRVKGYYDRNSVLTFLEPDSFHEEESDDEIDLSEGTEKKD